MGARGGDVMPSLRAPLAAGGVSPGRAARLRQGPARPQRSPQAAGDARGCTQGASSEPRTFLTQLGSVTEVRREQKCSATKTFSVGL